MRDIYKIGRIIIGEHAFGMPLQRQPGGIGGKIELGISRGLEFHIASVFGFGFIAGVDEFSLEVNRLHFVILELIIKR